MDAPSILQIVFLATLVGCVFGGMIWWFQRNVYIAALSGAAVIAAALWVTWPPPAEPVAADPSAGPNTSQSPTASTNQQSNVVSQAMLTGFRPTEVPARGYVASDACKECHQDNHSSWHASYHRTMTQVATADKVLGDFDNATPVAKERQYRLTTQGDVCWVEMFDPDAPPSPNTIIKVPIVMTTGSHHMQMYWYASGMPRTIGQLPLVHLKETNQWIPRSSANLEPPDAPTSSEMGRWNQACSKCHSTHQRERLRNPMQWDTQVAEFGISCEACHGPGEKHIALHRQATIPHDAIDPIVNPAALSHTASSQVCGQCHSVHTTRENSQSVREQGHGFRPGNDLDKTHSVWQRNSDEMKEFLKRKKFKKSDDEMMRSVFWDDGMVRVSGREFNGMTESSCFINGEMSCLSCHAMHQQGGDDRPVKEWANDQLSVDGLSDRACLQCHQADQYDEKHTHHAADSSGARCYNCHMPHTSYGLMKALRSHKITNPNVAKDLAARRPNACNLCHLDQTLDWTARHTKQWYGHEAPELADDQKTIAAGVLWLLKGDAAERAIAGWNMGWDGAHEASGTDWIAPILAQLLNDPYDAVRFIARRSMRTLPDFSDWQFNALAPQTQRLQTIKKLQENAKPLQRPELLMNDKGLQMQRLVEILKQRDETRLRLIE